MRAGAKMRLFASLALRPVSRRTGQRRLTSKSYQKKLQIFGPSGICTLLFVSNPDRHTSETATTEQRVRELLANKLWRKARDEAKTLAKVDRERYLPLVIEANLGLSREMLAKGLVSEAQQVLSYLSTIAKPDQIRTLELQLSLKKEQSSITAKVLPALADRSVSLTDQERLALADQVVLAFEESGTVPSGSEELLKQLNLIREGLQACANSSWDQVAATVRSIPHRSVFGHWALFLKGLAAFYSGFPEKAARFFSSLPASSVPGKAGRVYQFITNPLAGGAAKTRELSAAVLAAACELVHFPGSGPLLQRAQDHWQRGEYFPSYRVWRDGLTEFPTDKLNCAGALTDFYFSAGKQMGPELSAEYTDAFACIVDGGRAKNLLEELWIRRMLAQADSSAENWEDYLAQREKLHGPNPRLASRAYGRCGAEAAKSMTARPFCTGKADTRKGKKAIRYLLQAIELDATNSEAHLALLSIYSALRNKAEQNRLLEKMVTRFPARKEVLYFAGCACLERSAYVKALGYLKRARELDSLDPSIAGGILVALRKLAWREYRENRVKAGRARLAETEPLLVDKRDDFQRNKWSALSREAVLEKFWGDPRRAEGLFAAARASCGSPEEFTFFTHLIGQIYARKDPGLGSRIVLRDLSAAPALRQLPQLIRILEYCRAGDELPAASAEESLLRTYLREAIRRPFSREEAIAVLELKAGDPSWQNESLLITKKVLRKDRKDPLFRIYDIVAKDLADFDPFRTRFKLEEILSEATQRKDQAAAEKARKLMMELDRPPQFLDFDDDENDDDDDDLLDPEFSLEPNSPPFEPEGFDTPELREMMQAIARMTESELRDFRKTKPKEMPSFVLDLLIEEARGSGPGSGGPKKNQAGNPARPGPEQGELF